MGGIGNLKLVLSSPRVFMNHDSPVENEIIVESRVKNNNSVDDEGEEGSDAMEDTDDDLISCNKESDTGQKSHETHN